MSNILVRQATMDDTQAISRLFRSQIDVWQRFDENGHVEELPHEQLTIYERWLHGGAWMSIETSAIFLSHLLCGGGLPFVAILENSIVGYIEVYPGSEAGIYGRHLHIGTILSEVDYAQQIKDALLQHIINLATKRITVAFSSYDKQAAAFYKQYGMQHLIQIKQYTIPAKTGQSFYQATEYQKFNHTQIAGWEMSVGRLQSAQQHWENLWPSLWNAFPDIIKLRTHRLQISAAGQEAFICIQQQLYNPRSADVYCWSPKSLTKQLFTAIRDWAHRQNYRTLVFAVPEATTKLFGDEAEANPYQQDIYALDV